MDNSLWVRRAGISGSPNTDGQKIENLQLESGIVVGIEQGQLAAKITEMPGCNSWVRRGHARIPHGENPGRLLADLHPNARCAIVFIASVGGGNETPFSAKDLTQRGCFQHVRLTRNAPPSCGLNWTE